MLSDRCDVAEIGLEIIRKVLTLQRGVRLFRKRCFPNDNQKNVFDRHERELEEEITSLIMVGNELRCNRHIPDEEYKPRKRRRKR